ncbi:MAG: right-handed parallel beta-helix repeat-containing protein, partial [Patescibacteria group bacterium]
MTTIKRIASNRLLRLISLFLLLAIALRWFYPLETAPNINIAQRPALNSARAATEWYVSPTGEQSNTGSIDSPWNLSYALAGAGDSIQPGDTVWMRGGTYGDGTTRFDSTLDGTEGNRITVRQYSGERATINGQLRVNGSNWIDYWGFDIMHPTYGPGYDAARDAGIWTLTSSNNRFINLTIHDVYGSSAFGFWSAATSSEIYGSLIYENGRQDDNLDHGIYTQNGDGTKGIRDNFIFNNWAYGIHAYGSEIARVDNYLVQGNTFINNGRGNQGDVLLGGSGNSNNLQFLNNYLYNSLQYTNGVQFGYTGGHQSMKFNNNYIAMKGEYRGLFSRRFNNIEVTGNTIMGLALVGRLPNVDGMVSENWNNNSYYQIGSASAFYDGSYMQFDAWKTATGYDASSTLTSGQPTGTVKAVRPNEFESNRSHITVYNWDNLDSVSLSSSDLSGTGISSGDTYAIKDVQNYFGDPIATGTYNGSEISVTLPDTGSPVYQPASGSAPAHTSKQFNAFVLTYTPATYHTITPSVSGQGSLSISSPTQVL